MLRCLTYLVSVKTNMATGQPTFWIPEVLKGIFVDERTIVGCADGRRGT